MGKLDIDEAVHAIKQLMLLQGTWPKRSPTFTYRITGFLTMFAMSVFTVATLLKVFTNFADLQSVSFGICCSLSSFDSLVKHYMLFFNKPQFHKILKSLRNPILASHEDHLDVFLQDKLRLSKLYRTMYLFACLSTGFLIILFPIFDTKTERPLPVPFPLDMQGQHWLVYYSIYTFQCISLVITCLSIPCFDGIIFTFIAVAAGQLRIVREKIIRATSNCPPANYLQRGKHYDTVVNGNLKECVKHHIAIERYLMLIENTFTIGCLIQLLISVVIVCLLGFNFLLLSVTSLDFIRCLFFFAAVLTELAFFCIPANEIILQSAKIRDACYMSEWTNCGVSVRKTLFIIMERCKRPSSLTAARFVDLSLDTLVSVLKSSFSYFTMLKQVYTDSNKR